MLIKINRLDCINKYPKLPLRQFNPGNDEYDSLYPKTFVGYVLTLSSQSFTQHVELLGTEIVNLATRLGFDSVIFLCDLDKPWLTQDCHFKPAKAGLQYLSEQRIGKKFSGALQVPIAELRTFIKHLTWIIRTNAILPYVPFVDPDQHVIGTVCQYGKLHIYTVRKKTGNRLTASIGVSKFEYLTDEICSDKFSKKRK